MHSLEPAQLERYRVSVVDDDRGGALRGDGRPRRAGYELGGQRYKRTPRGSRPSRLEPTSAARGDFGCAESFCARSEDVFTSRFPRFCAERYRPLALLLDWLRPAASASSKARPRRELLDLELALDRRFDVELLHDVRILLDQLARS